MNRGAELAAKLKAARQHLLVGTQQAVSGGGVAGSAADGEWSIVEILSHLVDVDRHWLHEALAIRDDTDHVFVHFDDERWKAGHPDAREESLESVLARLAESHAAVIAALEGMSEGDLNRAGHHPTRGHPYTAAHVFERYVAHDANHAAQIAAVGA